MIRFTTRFMIKFLNSLMYNRAAQCSVLFHRRLWTSERVAPEKPTTWIKVIACSVCKSQLEWNSNSALKCMACVVKVAFGMTIRRWLCSRLIYIVAQMLGEVCKRSVIGQALGKCTGSCYFNLMEEFPLVSKLRESNINNLLVLSCCCLSRSLSTSVYT